MILIIIFPLFFFFLVAYPVFHVVKEKKIFLFTSVWGLGFRVWVGGGIGNFSGGRRVNR